MRVVKGIVLLRTGAEISQPSSGNQVSASPERLRRLREVGPDDELNLDHWTSAQRRTREDSSPTGPAAANCEDWT